MEKHPVNIASTIKETFTYYLERTTFMNELSIHIYLKNEELEREKMVRSLRKRLWTNRGIPHTIILDFYS